MVHSTLDQRHAIQEQLCGEHIRLPDIDKMFGAKWPFAVNPNIQALRAEISRRLDQMLPPSKRTSRLKAADPGFFAACWWPYASMERLRAAAWLGIWLFAWDDEMDSLEFSQISKNLGSAYAFREETRRFLSTSLGIDEGQSANEEPHPINALFIPAAMGFCAGYTCEKRKGLMKELDLFIDQTAREQVTAMETKLPTCREYLIRRMGSSAVGVCLAISEYCLEMNLPSNFANHELKSSLWQQTNMIVSIVNDILSISKELKQGQLDSLIPILFVETNDLQVAVNQAAKMTEKAVAKFEATAVSVRILARSMKPIAENDSPTQAIEGFIQSCQYACTANLYWSLSSGRYGLNCESLHGGKEIVV